MQTIYDLLSFKLFISPYVLFIFYYFGAIVVPVASWFLAVWIKQRYWQVSEVYESGKAILQTTVAKKYRIRFIIIFVMIFLFMEVMWRVMFEFLLAYLQMRDALLQLTTSVL